MDVDVKRGSGAGNPYKRGVTGSIPVAPTRLSARRGNGEDSIYFDPDRNRYVGAVSLGFGGSGRRLRRKVTGKTKAEVRRKVKELHADLGPLWQDNGLVFTTSIGTMLDQHNIRRDFRLITEAAGLASDWVPRELRHTFVSIMSEGGVPVEEIARVAGHEQTSTTELVYRRELRPVITTGAEIMDRILGG